MPAAAPAVALDAQERMRRHREATERRRTLAATVSAVVPGEERAFYLKMLHTLFISMLYQHLDRDYLQHIRSDIGRLLSLYWDLLPDQSPKEKLRKLSRAVEMAYNYRQRHPGYKIYDPLSFLRMDYQGGFHTVVTQWLPKEEFKLKMYAEKRSKLMIWQKGQAYSDELFLRVIEALKKGYFTSQEVFSVAKSELNRQLGRLKAPEATRERLRTAFADRFKHFYHELHQHAFEEDDVLHDPTWQTFKRWTEMNSQDDQTKG